MNNVMSCVRLADEMDRQTDVLCGKFLTLNITCKLYNLFVCVCGFFLFFLTPAMLIGTIDFYHFMLLSLT